eukprot:Lithocolla_globosa_v1_NODE_1889_length_2271_cov_14.911101.p3 type:complete len:194 gc:universal NODE_1889_length_2271_cov_14.911101:1229-1810(+)
MASISSKMMMCSALSSPRCLYSASASAKRLRMFSSDCPTNLLRISGPKTILGSRAFNILPICLAINVLPVPGGPKSSTPLTCWMPRRSTSSGGKMRDAKARRKMLWNCSSSPPMPRSSNLKLGCTMGDTCVDLAALSLIREFCDLTNEMDVSFMICPKSPLSLPSCFDPSISTKSRSVTTHAKLTPWYSKANF